MDVEVDPGDVDWVALHALVTSAYAYMDGRIDPPSSLHRMSAVDFTDKAAAETLITAVADGVLLGCLFASSKDGWLYVAKMAVAPQAQRSGIAENHWTFANMGFVKVGAQSHEGYTRVTNIRMRAPLPHS